VLGCLKYNVSVSAVFICNDSFRSRGGIRHPHKRMPKLVAEQGSVARPAIFMFVKRLTVSVVSSEAQWP
jgi:hypothetical protein